MREVRAHDRPDQTDGVSSEVRSSGPKAWWARAGWPVAATVLVAVLAMIAIGVAGVLSVSRDPTVAAGVATAVSAPAPSMSPDRVTNTPSSHLGVVSFVDLRSGEATALPRSMRKISGAGHFRVSPDDSMIAFDDGGTIFVANVDGTSIRRFHLQEPAWTPGWSPDGRNLVVSQGDTISLVDVATGRATRVVRGPHEIWNPNFSADGRTILYTTLRHHRLVMRTVPSDGGPSSFLMVGAFGAYSPDGTTIAYRKTGYDGADVTEMTSGRVWLADADGGHPREIGRSCCWMSQVDPEALWPTWSPDGTRIAYQPLYGYQVKVVDVGTGRGRPVGEGVDPSWLDAHTLIVTGFEETSS